MNPPSLSGIPLFDSVSGPRAGGAFGLLAPARESQTIGLDGWQVQVAAGFPSVVAHGGLQESYDDAHQASLLSAQRALDLMSMHGANNLVIKGIDEEPLDLVVGSTGTDDPSGGPSPNHH